VIGQETWQNFSRALSPFIPLYIHCLLHIFPRILLTPGRSPVQDAKAIKNEVEQEGMRQCHIRDGTALVEYFAWLENELNNGAELDEVQAADKLEEFRR
jgi:Xaa-Pro aminopeptidase